MTEFLLAAALFVLGTVALGLIRVLRGPDDTDRMLAAQLLGTGGVASLLLLGVANGVNAIGDLALLLALLAAFASVAFVTGAKRPASESDADHRARPGAEELTPTETLRHEVTSSDTAITDADCAAASGDGGTASGTPDPSPVVPLSLGQQFTHCS
jgi:multicomponent Na+:H+ antiporter subunit F